MSQQTISSYVKARNALARKAAKLTDEALLWDKLPKDAKTKRGEEWNAYYSARMMELCKVHGVEY